MNKETADILKQIVAAKGISVVPAKESVGMHMKMLYYLSLLGG